MNGAEDIQRLQTIPEVGDKTALAFTAYVGDGKRFNNGDEVAHYLGLVPRVDCSGSINRYGHITKKGNRIVRALLYQAAWAIVRSKHGGALKAKYFYMTEHGKGKKISITAIARKKSKIVVRSNEDTSVQDKFIRRTPVVKSKKVAVYVLRERVLQTIRINPSAQINIL